MFLEITLEGASRLAWEQLVDFWEYANRSVLIPVIVGIFAYFARRGADGLRMSQSLAQILRTEIDENRRAIMRARRRGVSLAEPMRINGVYRGLLASGNIRYLRRHQAELHRLYSMTSSGDLELPGALEDAMIGVRSTECPPVRRKIASLWSVP